MIGSDAIPNVNAIKSRNPSGWSHVQMSEDDFRVTSGIWPLR